MSNFQKGNRLAYLKTWTLGSKVVSSKVLISISNLYKKNLKTRFMVWFLCQFQQNHASLSLGHKNLNLNPPNSTLQIKCVHNIGHDLVKKIFPSFFFRTFELW
jgi:hypothetical protein